MRLLSSMCLALACAVLCPGQAAAHSGGLNADGCHNDRKNGGYHCHRGGGAAKPAKRQFVAPRSNLSIGGTVYYANCSEARAAGAAPVAVGEPGYGRHLDRDGDGVGCE